MELKIESTKSENVCKGKVYKVIDNNFLASDGSYHTQRRYRYMKRKSCKGCQYCDWINDTINEGTAVIDGGHHGDYVTLVMANQHTDWETGMVDDFDLRFIPYREVKKDGV